MRVLACGAAALAAGLIAVAASTFVSVQAGGAEVDTVLGEVRALRRELRQMSALLQQAPRAGAAGGVSPIGRTIDLGDRPMRGLGGAAVVLVEYSDYQCPFCARHVAEVQPAIDARYVRTGLVRHQFRNLPIESIHPQAFKAAEAAECAGALGRFWPVHDRLFAQQSRLAVGELVGHAAGVGLDAGAFAACVSSARYAARVRQDIAEARQFGITATPAFLVVRTTRDAPGVAQVVEVVTGAKPFAVFQAALDRALAAGAAAPPAIK